MVKLAANLSLQFAEFALSDRFKAAKEAGFDAIELMFPYELELAAWHRLVESNDLEVAIFNTPAGDWAAGDRGLGALRDRVTECRDGIATAVTYAGVVGCSRLHLMSGVPGPDKRLARDTMIDNLRFAADLAAKSDICLLIEPINTRVDMPGYFLDSSSAALDMIDAAGCPNVKLLYDVYHMQIMEGDLARSMERLLPVIEHVQIADNPGRAEPGTGEINFDWLLGHLDGLGYSGFVGCEYRPATNVADGLGWAAPFLNGLKSKHVRKQSEEI